MKSESLEILNLDMSRTSKLLTRRGLLPITDGVVNYLFQTPKQHHRSPPPSTSTPTSTPTTSTTHPIVLIGGTAQTIHSLVGHHSTIANSTGKGLLQYELRGQGRTTTLPLDDCSLERHVEDFRQIIESSDDFVVSKEDGKVDLVGFSFGGRVALAIAAELPHRVRKIVCTGVPADRGATGRIILRNWLETLSRGDLESFLWQTMVDGHHPNFLTRHERRIEGWVLAAAEANRAEAIAGLVGQTHTDNVEDPWHTVSLARRAREGGLLPSNGLFLVGEVDRIASPKECRLLAEVGGWDCRVIGGAGHSVPIEKPREWREAVGGFLNHE